MSWGSDFASILCCLRSEHPRYRDVLTNTALQMIGGPLPAKMVATRGSPMNLHKNPGRRRKSAVWGYGPASPTANVWCLTGEIEWGYGPHNPANSPYLSSKPDYSCS